MNSQSSVSSSREIAATPEAIFNLLADPASHGLIDGSGTVVSSTATNNSRLSLGSRFGMSMKLGVPYRITNEVVEFEENRRIAWRHFGRHIWRYELEPTEAGTRVTETFDWSSALAGSIYPLLGYPERNLSAIEKTLERLANVVEAG